MRNVKCYLTDKSGPDLNVPLLTGGVYFEASARENHEGVHTAFLHLCQEVGRLLLFVHLSLCQRCRTVFSSAFFSYMQDFFSHEAAIERHQDVMHFDFHFLWELWITGRFPLMLRNIEKIKKYFMFVLSDRKTETGPHRSLLYICFSGWVIRVQSSGSHYIWLRFLQDGRSNIQTLLWTI